MSTTLFEDAFKLLGDCLCTIRPFLCEMVGEILLDFSKSGLEINRSNIANDILLDLQSIWHERFEKIFVIELHQAKQAGILKGETSEQRYKHFVEVLSQKTNQEFFLQKRYPILNQQLQVFKKCYLDYFCELCARLKKDTEIIAVNFSTAAKKFSINSIKFTGDPHNYFRRVAIIQFKDEKQQLFSVIYKPRYIKNEVFFNKFIVWLNDYLTKKLRLIKCVDREEYGWAEYIQKKDCESLEEVKDYYYRFGNLVAVVYALGICDVHCENVIACGGDPVVIDLECFGTGILDFTHTEMQNYSVLSSGMLPNYLSERNAVSDLSAFAGGGTECEIPFENSYLENIGRDDMYIARKGGFFSLQANRPTLSGSIVVPFNYKKNVIIGFETAYNVILKNRDECLKYFARSFKDISSRIVLRSTSIYMKLMLESYHPLLLNNSTKYKKHFEWLKNNSFKVESQQESIKQIFISEIEQIKHQDIPLFKLFGNVLYDAYGNTIPIAIRRTIEEIILEKIQQLSSMDLKNQTNLIDKSINAYILNYPAISTNNYCSSIKGNVDERSVIQKVELILDRLLNNCLNHNKWTWPQHKRISVKDKYYWILNDSSSSDIYSGSLGILFVISYVYRIFKNKKYFYWLNLGINFVDDLIKKLLDTTSGNTVDLSLFNGLGGVLYFCVHSLNVDNSKIIEITQRVLKIIDLHLQKWLYTYQFDVVSGIAGLILVLDLLVKQNIEVQKSSKLIRKCKTFLIKSYRHPSKLPKKAHNINTKKAILGFSHGVSGIAYALYRTEDLTSPDPFILKWIEQALNYERKNFSLEYQGWPNFFTEQRKDFKDKIELFQSDWCHGALGIGVSRLELKRLGWHDNFIDLEIAISILSVKAEKPQLSLNLCHGFLGRFDYFTRLHKEKLITDEYFVEERIKLLDRIMHESNLVSEIQQEVFIPGLMTGQAGIIYEVLRALYPDKLPSILFIE